MNIFMDKKRFKTNDMCSDAILCKRNQFEGSSGSAPSLSQTPFQCPSTGASSDTFTTVLVAPIEGNNSDTA